MSETSDVPDLELPPADYEDAAAVVRVLAPEQPVQLFRQKMLWARALTWQADFPGHLAYSVRANNNPAILKALAELQLQWYGADSLAEIEAVRAAVPEARMLYLHPVKPPSSVLAAYTKHRVRDFVIDHPEELERIRQQIGTDATLIIRIAAPPGAQVSEGYRFGCDIDKAAWLAKQVVAGGFKLGLGFHLGSQVMQPALYDEALMLVREVMYRARFMLDALWIGGGMPAIYEGIWPPKPEHYLDVINKGLARLHLPRTARIFATPGRALAADCIALLVRVEQRRGQMLYINDGNYGLLGSAAQEWARPPVRLIRPLGTAEERYEKFMLAGAAAYGEDVIPGPFYLPADTQAGDYIEIGQCGAYAGSLQTRLHLQAVPPTVSVADDPPIPMTADELPPDYNSGEYEPYTEPDPADRKRRRR